MSNLTIVKVARPARAWGAGVGQELGKSTTRAPSPATTTPRRASGVPGWACGANARNGVPRSREDTRRAIRALLMTPRWVARSDSWIAETVVCGKNLVADVRAQLEAICLIDRFDELERKNGGTYPRTVARQPAPAAVAAVAGPQT